jgi:hypothetical protein
MIYTEFARQFDQMQGATPKTMDQPRASDLRQLPIPHIHIVQRSGSSQDAAAVSRNSLMGENET